MVTASHHLKGQANAQFAAQDYSSAISTYDRALAELPNYLDYEAAVLQSNVAACHLKLEQWKEAADRCEKGLEALEREIPTKPKPKNNEKKGDEANKAANVNGIGRPINDSESESEEETPDEAAAIVELPDADEADTLAALESLRVSDARRADVHRIRTKLLLRRARARSAPTSAPAGGGGGGGGGSPKEAVQESTSNWSNLASALEDYKTLSTPPYFNSLPSSDQKTVRHALVSLPPRVDEAKQREVGEMMGKLKDLGNGILRPFGLSTDNFKVVPGEGGGYSLSFDGAGGK
jgi:tetratricopeptide (TPR) repeat protein